MSIKIILVKPQLAENVGMVARAMLNFELKDLRIVNGEKGELINETSQRSSSGAETVLNNAKSFSALEEAVNDINIVFATTARERHLNKPHMSLKEAVNLINNNKEANFGFLFGCEKSGLSNEDLQQANYLVYINTSSSFSSLNISQAVLLVGNELFNSKAEKTLLVKEKPEVPATFEELNYFFGYLEEKLDASGYFDQNLDKKKITLLNIKNIFLKSKLTSQEVKTLFGIFRMLLKDYISKV